MVFENGEDWQPIAPDRRCRHSSFGSALDEALHDLLSERNEFFDSLADRWQGVFSDMPMLRPGRYEDGMIFLYVPNAPMRFMMQSKLAEVRRRLLAMRGAPKNLVVKLEIHAK